MENNNTRTLSPRDGKNLSLWQKGPFRLESTTDIFAEGTLYDALIVGGGITGLTTALLLQKQGRQCLLAEAYSIGYGTTGGTTAHLNTFFDTPYNTIESDFGEDGAKLVAQSGKEAFAIIEGLVQEYAINCDFELKPGYLYAENNAEAKLLDDILHSTKKAGVDCDYAQTNGIRVPFKKSVILPNQGQFHPLKYIYRLAEEFVNSGGVIMENTFIRDANFEDGVHTIKSDNATIKAKNLVYATHMPPGITVLNFKAAPYRSYVIGARLADENAYPDCLSYDTKDPYHYFRTHVIDGVKYLVLGGEDHKTAHGDPEESFKALEDYLHQYYEVAEISFKWSSQYYSSADGLPYIGLLPTGNNTYAGSGYNGNGMMFGTIAGKIISDMICGVQSPYESIYSPSRIKPVAGFVEYVKENADVAYRFIADRFSADDIESLKELEPGDGTIVKHNGHKLAVYKDAEGKVTALNPVCTHTKCIVHFNRTEQSWDCPCHGGRFDLEGKVVTGPPTIDLQKVNL